MSALLPCPMCSQVVQNGALTRAVITGPSWLYARMTSAKSGADHFTWMGCGHATPIGPVIPIPAAERSITEARWDIEARRLLELRCAAWTAERREDFARRLGFSIAPVKP